MYTGIIEVVGGEIAFSRKVQVFLLLNFRFLRVRQISNRVVCFENQKKSNSRQKKFSAREILPRGSLLLNFDFVVSSLFFFCISLSLFVNGRSVCARVYSPRVYNEL